MAKRRRAAGASRSGGDFHRQTVLFQWALAKLGVDDLEQFKDRFQITPDSAGGLDERTGLHRFFEQIAGTLPTVNDGDIIPLDRLQAYEENILEHTQAMNSARLHHGQPKIEWKYHQYLALLLTELFLDRYFNDPDALRTEMNNRIRVHNETADQVDTLEEFPPDESAREQLSRLAFWCATGSGKTLLMHTHIRQFFWYHQQAFDAGKWPKLDQIILVTPNEGLSEQHAEELLYSGFKPLTGADAARSTLFSQNAIKILEIHKFREEHGQTTYATEGFEGCNLVLVDEGHRGAGQGIEGAWLSRRDQLSRGGFTIEYSATFKEGIKSISKPAEREEMRNRYARSILFDYAYRSFYRDGYGKDFTILNLEEDDKQRRYLTMALLLFYQQMKVWMDGGERIQPFQIDKPLWVFVGHTVVGRSSTKADRDSVSDVVAVLLFLKRFLDNSSESIKLIEALLNEGYVDHAGRNLLHERLAHLDRSGDKAALARALHESILRDIFNAPAGGALKVQLLKSADGEIAVRVGDNSPFGVVNVGDPAAVVNACEKRGITADVPDENRSSLFQGISRDDSPINLLVGSRKFTEGWNSWRVSSLGLMHMGRNEGTQIIQLFGRGVRLRGYRMSLRRSWALTEKPKEPANLRQVETLQVFGVKASYMKTFRDWIQSEVPEAMEKQVWDLPVVETPPERKLRTLKLKDEIDGVKVERGQAFRKLGPLVILRPPHETDHDDEWLRRHRTRLNWLPRVQGIAARGENITGAVGAATDMPKQKFQSIHRMMLDYDELLFGLEAFKATRGLDRLHATRDSIRALFERSDWYELLAASDDMRSDRFENRYQWQRMAQQLLNSYAERFYRFIRGRWEAPYIEVAELEEEDCKPFDTYHIESTDRVETAQDIEELEKIIQELRKAIGADSFAPWSHWAGKACTVPFARHLYQPLLYVGKRAQIRVSPVPLNESESQFIRDLAKWWSQNQEVEVYLLRNQAVTGLGFFQASNFYPDFLLWVLEDEREHLAFVDPKGLHHLELLDPKIQFGSREIPRLQDIISEQASDLILHSFILSTTAYASLGWSDGTKRLSREQIEELGVLFQKDEADAYIAKMMRRIRTTTTATTTTATPADDAAD